MRPALWILMVSILAAGPAGAQESGDHCGGGTISGSLLERPIALQTGIGRLEQKVSTASPEAQAYYDQGITYLASYVWAEAARSFHEALRRDPALAMAELGLAKARLAMDDVEGAGRRQLRAASLASGATEKERRWIALFGQQLEANRGPVDQRLARHLAYKRSLDSLVALDPDDAHAWVLRGNAEEEGVLGRGQFGGVASIAFYEAALVRDPDHLGAHHFLVHSYENINRHATAAEHGRIYAEAAPRVPHALHMYAHVLPRLGRWQEALELFARADRLHRDFLAADGVGLEEDWHTGHNLHLVGTVQLRLGKIKDAQASFRAAYDIPTREAARRASNAAALLEYQLMAGRFDDALRDAARLEGSPSASLRLLAATTAVAAHAGRKRLAHAQAALVRAEGLLESALSEVARTPYEVNRSRSYRRMVDASRALVGLHGKEAQAAGNAMVRLADAYAATGSFDGWGVGLFAIEQMAREAQRCGRKDLAKALRERQRRIDPTFPPDGLVATSR